MADPSGDVTFGALDADVAAPVLEADDMSDDDDVDSGFGSGEMSDAGSLTSSIFRFREENGRTYHAYRPRDKESDYFLPNDSTENARLDLQHNLTLLMMDNRLFACPAGRDKPLTRVLDVGCGTGIWSIDFATEHPETAVIGVDLSPIQPAFAPPNVEFFIDDVEEPWSFVNPFDFIMIRHMTGSIRDWPRLFQQAYQHLTPGGYIEVSDPFNPILCDDGTLPEDSAIVKWNQLLLEASVQLGAPLNSAARYKQQLIDAGFQNVVQKVDIWPVNDWPQSRKYKEIGIWNQANLIDGLEAYSLMLFTKVLGWSVSDVKELIEDVRVDASNRHMHGYWRYYIAYGQKPE